MPKYSTNNTLGGTQQAMTSTYKSLIVMSAQTTGLTRGRIYHFLIGTAGAPANNYMEYDLSRSTTIVTGTNVTPQAVSPADTPAGSVGTVNFTAEPTVTAASSLFYLPLNQQATFQWVAKDGCELWWPATALNGLTLRARSAAYTGVTGATIHHEE
jgi:hypothetical protein